MANPANYWKKGQPSPNPKGAPKREWTWAGEYQKAVEKRNLDGTPVKQAIAESLIDKSLQGDIQAIKELTSRMDGMPSQDVKMKGEIGHTIELSVNAGSGFIPTNIRLPAPSTAGITTGQSPVQSSSLAQES